MALEAKLIYQKSPPMSFTCADGTAIAKGSILKVSSPRTVALTTGDTDPVAGIAAEDKVASDGNTEISVYVDGLFECYAGAAGVTVGGAVITDTATGAANELVVADINSENLVGTALSTATDGNTFLLDLKPMGINLA